MPRLSRLLPWGPLLALLACPEDPAPPAPPADAEVAASLLPDGRLNHLLPLDVAVDTERRRLYSTCNALPTVAVIDLDGEELTAVLDLGLDEYAHAFLHPRDDGTLWVTHSHVPPVLRLWPDTGAVEPLETGIAGALAGVALPGGGLAVAGPRLDQDGVAIQILDADGALVAEEDVGDGVLGLTVSHDGLLAALLHPEGETPPELVLFELATLAPMGSCPPDDDTAAVPGTAVLRALSDGHYVATREESIHLIRCGGEPWSHQIVAGGHRDALEIDGRVLVLSRRGDESVAGLNWGLGRWFEMDLTPSETPFPTGKNSGYGQIDGATGRLWLNSEGTTELWRMDPASGALEARLRVGEHVESVRPDPGDPSRAFFTGRLTNTFGDVDLATGTFRTVVDEITWPLAPVRRGDAVWLVAGMTSELVEVDAATLAIRRVLDLGLPENTLLTFHGLGLHPGRDTLFLAHGEKNTLHEIDPDGGTVLGSWQLAGPDVDDWSRSGRVEVLFDGDAVVTFRNVDGWLTRVDPDQPEPVGSAQLGMDEQLSLRDLHRLDWAALPRDDGVLYVAGFALDAATLQRLPDRDLDATYVIGALGDDATLVWRRDDDTLAVLDGSGAERAGGPLDVAWSSAPDFALVPGEAPRLWYSELATAEVRKRALARLRYDAGR